MINKLSLNEQIYEALKRDIFTNRIESGSILVNKDLQNRFGVSSSPIRDAINRLEQDGLIDKITRAGAQVIKLDYKTTREINELMIIITIGAFDLFFYSKDKAELEEKLANLLILQEKHLHTDKYFYYDYRFHKLLFIYSGNKRLVQLYKQFSVLFEMAVRSLDNISSKSTLRDTRDESLKSHQRIVKAFKDNDLDKAKSEIKEHYLFADRIFYEHFENN